MSIDQRSVALNTIAVAMKISPTSRRWRSAYPSDMYWCGLIILCNDVVYHCMPDNGINKDPVAPHTWRLLWIHWETNYMLETTDVVGSLLVKLLKLRMASLYRARYDSTHFGLDKIYLAHLGHMVI